MQCRTEDEFSGSLGVPVRLAIADEPTPVALLASGERRRLHALRSVQARRDWLLGRAALRSLLPGRASVTSFPDPSVSLTHSGGLAIAVHSTTRLAGIGIDYEPWREQVHPRMATFFLRPAELPAAEHAAALVRLWTIKEALFKAIPDNGECLLLDLELFDPTEIRGRARGPRGEILRYASAAVLGGSLAVAINEPTGGFDDADR